MSSVRASAADATRMVCARSAAEMPVVTPCAASIDTVKFVPWTERLIGTIGDRLSRRACSSVIGMQISPRPNLAMKLTISGVTASAATTKSPSFSRSSSSTRMTMRPALMSAIISGIGLTAGADEVLGSAPPTVRRRGFFIVASDRFAWFASLYCSAADDLEELVDDHTARIAELAHHAEVMPVWDKQGPVVARWPALRPTLPQEPRLADELACLFCTCSQQKRRTYLWREMDRA